MHWYTTQTNTRKEEIKNNKKREMQFVDRTLCNIFQEKHLISTGNIKCLMRLSDKVNINDLIKTAGMSMGKDMGMFQDYLGKPLSF